MQMKTMWYRYTPIKTEMNKTDRIKYCQGYATLMYCQLGYKWHRLFRKQGGNVLKS